MTPTVYAINNFVFYGSLEISRDQKVVKYLGQNIKKVKAALTLLNLKPETKIVNVL